METGFGPNGSPAAISGLLKRRVRELESVDRE
jgi:hypothetical protein